MTYIPPLGSVNNYTGGYNIIDNKIMVAPREGPKAAIAFVKWTNYINANNLGAVQFDLSSTALSQIVCVFIDNTNGTQSLQVNFPDNSLSFTVQNGSQGWYPCPTNSLRLIVSTNSAPGTTDQTFFFFSNIFIPPDNIPNPGGVPVMSTDNITSVANNILLSDGISVGLPINLRRIHDTLLTANAVSGGRPSVDIGASSIGNIPVTIQAQALSRLNTRSNQNNADSITNGSVAATGLTTFTLTGSTININAFEVDITQITTGAAASFLFVQLTDTIGNILWMREPEFASGMNAGYWNSGFVPLAFNALIGCKVKIQVFGAALSANASAICSIWYE